MRQACHGSHTSANEFTSGWQPCPPYHSMRRQNFAIVLIGRSTLLREGLARLLSASEFRILASAPHAFDVVLSSPQEKTRSILFVIDVAGDLEAVTAEIKQLKEQFPAGRIAVVADHGELGDPTMLFRAGANVCVGNFATCDALLKTLELVMLEEVIFPFAVFPAVPRGESAPVSNGADCKQSTPAVKGVPYLNGQQKVSVGLDSTHAPRLSAREKCIMRCLAEGDSNKAIARKIAIAEATVKVHVKAILRKIRVQNRTQAAIWTINHNSFFGAIDKAVTSLSGNIRKHRI
jgi:two-component system, NarL family, nitrate/nitrite response regulator NarL